MFFIGLIVGGIIGFVAAALMAAAKEDYRCGLSMRTIDADQLRKDLIEDIEINGSNLAKVLRHLDAAESLGGDENNRPN